MDVRRLSPYYIYKKTFCMRKGTNKKKRERLGVRKNETNIGMEVVHPYIAENHLRRQVIVQPLFSSARLVQCKAAQLWKIRREHSRALARCLSCLRQESLPFRGGRKPIGSQTIGPSPVLENPAVARGRF